MRAALLLTWVCTAALMIGCGKDSGTTQGDSAAAAMAPARELLSLSDLAGTWSVRVMSANGDTALTTYQLHAKGEPAGWAISYRERPPIPLRVTVDADSLIYESSPYESVLRPGVRVWVEGAGRLVDGRLVGSYTAHYAVTTPDSIFRGRTEGTRQR
ncbi:MAG TPA: hypothetical protein VF178_02135 [Gemmatimonadaceae bacterium]